MWKRRMKEERGGRDDWGAVNKLPGGTARWAAVHTLLRQMDRQTDRWSDRWMEEPVVCPGLGVSCPILLDRCQLSRSGTYVSSELNSDLVALK